MGGIWGDSKIGPFCKRDNCSLVRGGLEKIDNPLVHVICTCIPGAGGWGLGAGLVATVLMEGVGTMGVAGMLVEVEVVVEVVEKLDGTFGCLLKVLGSLSILPLLLVQLLRL